jgi:transposase InsO family protein
MDDSGATSLEQIRAFLEGAAEVKFEGQRRREVYAWVERTLVQQEYGTLNRPGKGLVRQYVERLTGLSRAQVTRLIGSYAKTGRVPVTVYQRTKFTARYTATDVNLLAYVDKAHGNLSGPATKRILQREHVEYAQSAYAQVARISVAQLYRIRNSEDYRRRNNTYHPTKPTVIRIGERRKPRPDNRPGFLRLDTVHQGDQDGIKGVYHINAVCEVTQWEVTAAAAQISESGLIPALAAMLAEFPFVMLGFHSDNGSEFINYAVVKLLGKLLIEQTKSRARHSGDNGLVESKNGAVVRKHFGHGHIGAEHAEAINTFQREYLNPYLNFHRPCAVPKIIIEPNGKRRRVYKEWATPFELLKRIPQCKRYLRPGITLASLEEFAQRQSDTEAALAMQQAKRQLQSRIKKQRA